MPIDAAFAPDEELHAECMVNIPAIKFLYGENRFFAPNTMHQAYMDSLSDSLQELCSRPPQTITTPICT